jgi:hypothetical protein
VTSRAQIVDLLHRHRFPLSNEKMLQVEMATAFTKAGISFRREVRLDEKDIVDFMVDVDPCRPEAGSQDKERHSLTNPVGKEDAAGTGNNARPQIPGIAIEVKIGGSRRAIFRQLERYCEHKSVGSIVLATNVPMTLPCEINGKPTSIANLGMGWL